MYNKDFSKRLYAKALYNKIQKSKYVTEKTEIKFYMEPIVNELKKSGMENYYIISFFCDLFTYFNFENARNENYESLNDKVSKLIKRL